MSTALTVITEQEVLGKDFKIYGTAEEPLFLAKDVAEWIEHSDVSTMLRNIDDSEKVTNIVCTLGGEQTAWFLTEDGVYEVLMLSRKPIAKEFKTQVKAILKTIRNTGGFVSSADLMVQTYFGALDDTSQSLVKQLLVNIQEQQKQIAVLTPKGEFYDAVTGSDTVCDMGTVAKTLDMGIGRNKLFALLKKKKILQYNNRPYQKHVDVGRFRVIESRYSKPNGDEAVYFKTTVTQKGMDFIRKVLVDAGYSE